MATKTLSFLAVLTVLVGNPIHAQDVPFSPCPLLGPQFPMPTSLSTSPIIQSGFHDLTEAFDTYVATLNGTFGPISPSTSFSIVLFSTEETNSTQPFMYEYHHISSSLANETFGTTAVDAETVYPVGDLTTLSTTWLFLIEAGEQHWDDPVSEWVPELVDAANSTGSYLSVDWHDVTLGDLAAHLGGIGSYVPSKHDPKIATLLEGLRNSAVKSPCDLATPACDRAEFLSYFGKHSTIFAPGTTPIFSNAGFIILAYALESMTNRSYSDLLQSAILDPLNMTRTSYLALPATNNTVIPANSTSKLFDRIEGPFNGLLSTPHDLSLALRALLASTLLPEATTRRWFKPVGHTSNLVNTVGRPWEIYSLTSTPISPVIPIYQVRGNVGAYSSHIGLAPDYNTGFAILAADEEGSPDLNAHADILATLMIPVLEKNAIVAASEAFAGTYAGGNMTFVIEPAKDSSPGLSVARFTLGEKDVRAVYAKLNGIEPENLSFRLYPTNVGAETRNMMTLRASFQDVTELADAGTPTCETWRDIDQLQIHGVSLDEFVFEMEGDKAVVVSVPAFEATLSKQASKSN